jgi:hypothetical protein
VSRAQVIIQTLAAAAAGLWLAAHLLIHAVCTVLGIPCP